jgi:hypothetical protein
MKTLKITSIILLAIFLSNCKSTSNIPQTREALLETFPPKNMDIYLLIGQSNMAGRAPIEAQDLDSIKGVFLFTGNAEKIWEKAANPLNKYSTIRKKLSQQKLNPGYAFAQEMIATSNKQIGLVVNAKGGTSINLWVPGSDFYNDAVSRVKEAMKHGNLKGILWHQGESDTSRHKTYMAILTNLILSLRKDLDIPDLPFVAGQLAIDKPHRLKFSKMMLELPQKLPNTAIVKTEGTKTMDGTHFDAASQRLLGERYAIEIKKLLLLQKK